MTDPVRALREVAVALGPLLHRVVFVGGAAAPLLITDIRAADVRPTDDVDAVIDAWTRAQYALVDEQLRALGFRNDTSEGAPLCRYRIGDRTADVMPVDPDVLGFSNRWYPYALESAQTVDLSGVSVRVVSAPAFVATKLEAFWGRGRGDVLASHDLEDLVAVLDGRPTIESEVAEAPYALRSYLADAFGRLLDAPGFAGAVVAHVAYGPTHEAQARRVLATMHRIASH